MNYTTWEQRVRKVEPYTPGEQPKTDNVIKLNTNENPFPPSPMVEKVIKEYNEDALRLYPDTRADCSLTHWLSVTALTAIRCLWG